jgi:rubrerythrin
MLKVALGNDLPMNKQEFREMIEEQVQNEKKATELLYDSAGKTSNTVIRLMLHQLALDSTKHERMLKIILQLLESSSEEGFKSEDEEFRKVIEKHVEIEREMLRSFEDIVDKTEDKRIRLIIQDIISDEKRHHAIIKRVYELVCESEKVKDEKWWDFLYRYSRLTG